MVEAAIVMVVATMLIYAIFEFSMLGYTYATIYEAAHEGLRYAEVQGTDSGNYLAGCSTTSPSSVIAKVQHVAGVSLHDVSKLSVNVCYPDSTGSQPLSRVQITVSYTYVPYIQIPGVSQTMSIYSEGRIAY